AELGVLDRLLGHEKRLWHRSAQLKGLNAEPVLLEQAVAALALLGAADRSDARWALRRVPDLAEADIERVDQFIHWARELYPGTGSAWLEPLRPDLLAERHVTDQLHASPELARACFGALWGEQAMRALTVLARACVHHRHAFGVIEAALRADLTGLAPEAIAVAVRTDARLDDLLATVFADVPVELDDLEWIVETIPSPTLALTTTEIAITRRICDLLPPDTDPAQRAEWSYRLATALTQADQYAEALEPATEAVNLHRTLAQERPNAFLPDLAASLNDQSICLAVLGRREEA
ncbi:hypothetical protein, partial [Thermomonospora catenispora]|uniref:hypothetical protein n=1 Tax=Thermomonospora catenispora TaxID=2493090 RepID=UPI0019D5ECBF